MLDVDTTALRRKLEMSQAAFAASFGLHLRTVQAWEQGQRKSRVAVLYLWLVADEPETVSRVVETVREFERPRGKKK